MIRSMKVRAAALTVAILLLNGCASHELAEQPPEKPAPGQNGGTNQHSVTEPNQPVEPTTPADEPDQQPPAEEPPPKSEIEKQLKEMSLDEKLGSMIIAGVEGKKADARAKRMIAQQHVGGVIFYKDNVATPSGVAAYVNQLKTWNSGNASPLLVTVDEEGGRVARLPGLVALPSGKAVGNTGDAAYAGRIGHLLGEASKAMGFNVDFAPVLDINSNPNNPVIGDRSFGATADLVTKMGLAVMEGLQDEKVVPVVKHFPGHGDTSVDSHLELPIVYKSLSQLKAFEWRPFQEAIGDGADVVMIAHILFPKLDAKWPASLSKRVITDELRGTLRFEGVVVTDDLTMGAIANHYGMGEAAVQAVKAGSDIVLIAHEYANVDAVIAALKKSISKGELTEQRINKSVLRILALKERYELSDTKVPAVPDLKVINAAIREQTAAAARVVK
ncbi:beta-N-acetylhexosaminidase [Paenibacillus sp. OV219]|uniref:beta-N-acetylhexosaminidase n=1 Tax=Paenibacillus sp. OV219 TaxID=1884377 RepID=UPI0008BF45D0|nr:beta-N-acetylhexosaminidase [Paenibacillus sp. OV219]SEN58523.1 beta-N-acetylhexosaminidase [Paenibacillus sp. OV219]